MSQEFFATRLDVKAFVRASGVLAGQEALAQYPRLLEETGRDGADRPVQWQARGELREDGHGHGHGQIWLHLHATASLPLVCQRCLGAADVDLLVDRSFRFVATEAEALAQDELAEEDVLVLSRDFNLHELIEDELLMEMPAVPRHEVCPAPVKMAVQDPDFDAQTAEKARPFAVLAGLRGGGGN
jgi:uncharacterized protein